METKEVKNQVEIVESGVKVVLPSQEKPVYIQRKMSPEGIANDITSRITGKLIGFGDLYDPKTQSFLSENELTAKGACFVTLSYGNIAKMTKKDRVTGQLNPFGVVTKKSIYQVIVNIDWQSYINRRSEHGQFIQAEKRANGVENYAECRAVGITKDGNFTINGVAFKTIESAKYFDENGREIDKSLLVNYLPDTSASKKKEAEKHGIKVEFDPQYRTTRIDSCEYIRGFGFEYTPIK